MQKNTSGIKVSHCTVKRASLTPHETQRSCYFEVCTSLAQNVCLGTPIASPMVNRMRVNLGWFCFSPASCQIIFIQGLLFGSIHVRKNQERTEAESPVLSLTQFR